jgi:hypothetical protein
LDFLKKENYNSLDVMTYHLDSKIFANSSLNPENEGFCDGQCLGNGVLNMSSCSGINLFLSQPHFLNADKKFPNAIDGMTPNITLHDYIFKFEPVIFNHNYKIIYNLPINNCN